MEQNTYSLLKESNKSTDFQQIEVSANGAIILLSYYRTMINNEQLHHDILAFIQTTNCTIASLQDLKNLIPLDKIEHSSDTNTVSQKIMKGSIYLQLDFDLNTGLIVELADSQRGYRRNNDTENEYSVIGPKAGFVEDLDSNLNLLRKVIVSSNLLFEEIIVGSVSKTRVVIAYMEGTTNPQHVNTARQRLQDLDFDIIYDSSILDQLISEHTHSPFPLLLSTERIDRIVYCLVSGQIAILSNGSPYVIAGPTTLFDFFISPEDYYLPWILGTFFRIIRYLGVSFSIFATPFYIAVITFHYAVIPKNLMGPIIESRMNVPFAPLLEVLFLEISIELLREAGARLPTKIGQTLGIVGGVVLGQAAVHASLTSSILIIIVSLSALASFTTPIYKMSSTIRFLRFPIMLLAATWGGLGIAIGSVVLLGHLMRLRSLGSPYLVPLFPFRHKDYQDSFIRSSFSHTSKRPRYLLPLKLRKYSVNSNKDVGDDYSNE